MYSLQEAQPRLVMFDLDGTLLDSVPDLAAAVDVTLARLGRPAAGVEQVQHWVGNGALVLVRRALAGQVDHSGVSEQDANEALEIFLQAYAGSHSASRVYPGVREALDWLTQHQVELALITNKPEQFVAPLLEEKGLGHYFRWIIGGDTLAQKKPDPAGILHVLRLSGVTPAEALFVGDSRTDVQAAQAAGVPCVAVSYGYNHGQPISAEQPTMVVDDLRQLLP